jgi:hypothetical protein
MFLCCRYWNYLRRQLFVLDTYYSPTNRTTNHTMMLLHSYGSAVFAAAAAASLLQLLLAAAAAAAAAGGCSLLGGVLGQHWASPGQGLVGGLAGVLAGVLAGGLSQACAQLCPSSSSSSSSWGVVSAAAAAVGLVSSRGLAAFVVCVSAAQLSIWFMARQCLGLMTLQAAGAPTAPAAAAPAAAAAVEASHARTMSDQQPPAALAITDTPGSLSSQRQQQRQQRQGGGGRPVPSPPSDRQLLLARARVSFPLLWAGWVLENAILPACMAYTFYHDWISWGGIRYLKAGGKVARVVHPHGR